ncbi:hypothetical protein [Rhizobium sp. P007]|uniref:hypothetical protein n=1 Tax=Rhizobium sp. P007 TaxID=285908 RepID=UPI0011589B01|nr:hypothetical protein [Rhizobium sp. P007]CAD7058571.1 hypothetical protein RP007_02575 [Rhizobium sp. P007]
MAKRATKAAAKQAAYEETMTGQTTTAKRLKARWVKHTWCEETDSLKTRYWPAAFPGAKSWHREGSLDEIEQRENAGHRELF